MRFPPSRSAAVFRRPLCAPFFVTLSPSHLVTVSPFALPSRPFTKSNPALPNVTKCNQMQPRLKMCKTKPPLPFWQPLFTRPLHHSSLHHFPPSHPSLHHSLKSPIRSSCRGVLYQ